MGKKIMTLDSVAAEICKSTFLGVEEEVSKKNENDCKG